MRVGLIVEQLFAPVPGGTARYTHELATALVATQAPGDELSTDRFRLRGRALALAWQYGRGPRVDADVVHAPTLLLPPVKKGLVVTIHDAVPWTHPATLSPHGVRWHVAMAERAERSADVVITPSQAAADELCQFLQIRDRVRVIPHGVSASLVVPDDAPARRARLRLPEVYALAVGTLEPRKGLDLVARAAALATWPIDVGLVVAGPSGWGEIRAPRGATMTGSLDDADLAAVMAGALCLLAPSRSEGFGLPVLEAMALGTPVVVSSARALVELVGPAGQIVEDGDPGLLADAVRTLLENPAVRAERAAAGQSRAAGYTWEKSAHAHWAAYADAAR